MTITRLKNGNLEMTANVNERSEIKHLLRNPILTMIVKESQFIATFLGGDPMGDGISYEQVAPEEVGALTGAPLISDGEHIYGHMQYAITNFLDELVAGRSVEWQKG